MCGDGADKKQGYPGRMTKVIRLKKPGDLFESPYDKNQIFGYLFSSLTLVRRWLGLFPRKMEPDGLWRQIC